MFTGIVEAVGRIKSVDAGGDTLRVHIDPGGMDLSDVAIGDSIAVNGACLTVAALENNSFAADISGETLNCTCGLSLLTIQLTSKKRCSSPIDWTAIW
jgi:riboflavin synthase